MFNLTLHPAVLNYVIDYVDVHAQGFSVYLYL